MIIKEYLEINPEVKEALENGKPVVALESTIISHGMPYPQNIETARKVEEIVRKNGAVPATIAIIGGVLKVGLTDEELEYFGKEEEILKASRRDLPFIISKKLDGATTVASTMIIADLAGIKVFVTGGIGGVHRGAEETFDISADLEELSKTDVAVVCAGVKSILDIGLTLEYLETNGVPVVGYQTDELPAFYSPISGFGVDYKAENPVEIAEALKAKWDLELKGGMVIANPIKAEDAMDHERINEAINEAIYEAEKLNIKGKAITPYLLGKVKDLTKGDSLKSNIKLVYNNAEIGSKIAVAYQKLV
jgi:pseudouridine-5'-phosphate glycosidase